MAQNGKRYLQIFSAREDERGASMVEYALLASLIAVAAISSVQKLGFENEKTLRNVGEQMACAGVDGGTCSAAPPPGPPPPP